MALNIITNNPYRIIGVYPTSTRKEIVANIARIKANIRVDRTVTFPTDLDVYLNRPDRKLEDIANAEAKLALPADTVRYALFWFINTNELDAIALNNLAAGAYDKAIAIWEKKNNVSSIHNRVVAYLLKGNFDKALNCAYIFHAEYKKEFTELVLGSDSQVVSIDNLGHDFLDILCEEIGASEISLHITNQEWGEYVSNKIVSSLIESLEHCINVAKQTKGKGSNVRLNSGTKLITDTLPILQNLKKEISQSNPKYQIIVDKLGLEILQCSIDYYNESTDDDTAYKALKLQKYAQSIIVGKLAKDRCDENIHTLEGIISKLPPVQVMSEHKAIQSSLKTFAIEPELIKYSIKLIKSCVTYIVSIKEKLGVDHSYYRKISTTIVSNALGNVITEVNAAQGKDFETLKGVLIEAWRTQLYMDKFDLEQEFEEGRYKQSREALYGIIDQCKGFEDSTFSFMYKYGCGWCNKLNVDDVDLRTDDEFYVSCNNLASFKSYVKRYPSGKHIVEANQQIEVLAYQNAHTVEALSNFIKLYPQSKYVPKAKSQIIELRFKGCKSISDFRTFINDFPTCKFVSKAQDAINRLIREENERKARIARQEKAISTCRLTDDVLDLYAKEKNNHIDVNKCSSKAYELAKTESDYRKILSTFGVHTLGGQKAKSKVDEIERARKKKEARKKKILQRSLWVAIPLIILLAIYLIWGIRGFAVGCTIVAVISGIVAFGAMQDKDGGCGTFLICAAIAAVFGFSAAGLHEWDDRIDDDNESNDLYKKIASSPKDESCLEYIQRFSNMGHADDVRDIWLNLLLKEANSFDYDSYKEDSEYSSTDNPIKKLQEFISKNTETKHAVKALSVIESICDSLYNVADKRSTTRGWKQYQSLVPTDYLKDSESKIQDIENQAWNTEAKAWKMALSENDITAYSKYKTLYPHGEHISQCEKKLIDLQVSEVYAGEHGSLPEMDRTGYGGGPTSHITVTNSTSYTLTLLYSGPDSKRLVVSAGGTSSIRLKNGNYRVAASVSASNVTNYAGNETLHGGNYSVDYYISTYRY